MSKTRPGLTTAETAARLAADGPNELARARRTHPLVLLLRQLVHLFAGRGARGGRARSRSSSARP
ncbi:cation-transporting P-type ATPase [Nonomuraea sp. NPDC049504]